MYYTDVYIKSGKYKYICMFTYLEERKVMEGHILKKNSHLEKEGRN